VNNCPSCKKSITVLKLSMIKGTDTILPPFNCATLCCPLCGVIIMAAPDLGSAATGVTPVPVGH